MLSPFFRSRRLAAAVLAAGSIGLYLPTIQAQDAVVGPAPVEVAPVESPQSEVAPGEIAPGEIVPAPQGTPGGAADHEPGALSNDYAGGGGAGCPLASVISAAAAAGRPTIGGCRDWGYGRPDLFYNFYVPPTCGGIGAYLYTSPGPIPPHVGHTHITYQPLMPHEQLYPHHRVYHRYYDEGRGLSRAHVKWYCPPVRTVASEIHSVFKLAR